MIAELPNHLWQSTMFAVAVWLLAFAFRRNRAQVRYGLWLLRQPPGMGAARACNCDTGCLSHLGANRTAVS